MISTEFIDKKIFDPVTLKEQIYRWKFFRKKIAFTNGCFDILHTGHIYSLSLASREADVLVIGLNSDASTKRLKGENRPVNDEKARATVLSSLLMVDAIVLFDEDTPLELIKQVQPDVLVKGGDYTIDQIVGASEVIASGGRVVINPIVEGYSTTSILEKIAKL